MKRHHSSLRKLPFRASRIIVTAMLWGPLDGLAQVDSWNSPASGHWEDSTWSLGVPPGANQSVMITNAGSKAVGVFPSTPLNFPGTMTISNLTISAPAGYVNTLLLNYAGTAAPLQLLDGGTIGTNASLVNFYSGLTILSNSLSVVGGTFVQEGGATSIPNGSFSVQAGSAAVTNAMVSFSSAYFIGSTFTQSGGSVTSLGMTLSGSSVDLWGGFLSTTLYVGYFGSGHVTMHGGQVESPYTQIIDGDFSQNGGSVSNGNLQVGGFNSGLHGNYSLNDGVLSNGNVSVNNGYFYQSNGVHTVIGGISIFGFFDDYAPVFFGNYTMQNGFLSCGSISLGVFGTFSQINGTNSVSGDLSLDSTGFSLSGGSLATSNSVVGPGRFVAADAFFPTHFLQSGGLHRITNKLSCAGHYSLDVGALIAPVIILGGQLDFGPSPAATISNAISFELAGTIQLSSSTQHLAATVLSGNSLINFYSGNCKLTFANSRDKSWMPGVTLTISNWNGFASGGGPDQLFFGNAGNGLAPAQLEKIQFINPAGFAAGIWYAKILPTGEVVPAAEPTLAASLTGTSFVVEWPTGNFVLQAATNVSGPFMDVSTSGRYTNDVTQFPRRFFRLRQ